MAITPLTKCCSGCFSKALPAAFDESLSYLEFLGAIKAKQDELISQVNYNTEFIENWSGDLEELKRRMTAVEEYVDSEIAAIRQETTNQINDAENRININATANINAAETRINATLQTQVNRLDTRIDNVAIGKIKLVDPTTGLLSDLQVVIDNIATASRENGLTATEYDALELTATAYAAYDITAYQYDYQGKTLLV